MDSFLTRTDLSPQQKAEYLMANDRHSQERRREDLTRWAKIVAYVSPVVVLAWVLASIGAM